MKNLFLVPASQENLNRTIFTRIPFNIAEERMSETLYRKLRGRINNSDGFHCWAMKPTRQSVFDEMRVNDIVLFKPNGIDAYRYKAKVVHTLPCNDLGNHLWSVGEKWYLIYFLEDIEEIEINFQKFSKNIGYEEPYHENRRRKNLPPKKYRDCLQGIRRVNDELMRNVAKRFGSIEAFLELSQENSFTGIPLHHSDGSMVQDRVNGDSRELKDLKEEFKNRVNDINALWESGQSRERDHESRVESFYLNLGCNREQIRFQAGHVDILIQSRGRPLMVTEVKRDRNLTRDNRQALRQAYDYANRSNPRIRYVMITNGDLYGLYDLNRGGGYEENFKYEFRLTHLQEEDVSKVDDLKKILKMEGSVNHEQGSVQARTTNI